MGTFLIKFKYQCYEKNNIFICTQGDTDDWTAKLKVFDIVKNDVRVASDQIYLSKIVWISVKNGRI